MRPAASGRGSRTPPRCLTPSNTRSKSTSLPITKIQDSPKSEITGKVGFAALWYKTTMWLATRYGFYSIACALKDEGRSNQLDPDTLMIRARQKRHLENLKSRFPELAEYGIRTADGTDYACRLILPKQLVVRIVGELLQEQVWGNFKNEAARFLGTDYSDYHQALHRVWAIMQDLQEHERRVTRRRRTAP